MSKEESPWHFHTDSEYWLYAALLQANDHVYISWNLVEGYGLELLITCNDVFVGAADSEPITPQDVAYLIQHGYHRKKSDDIYMWIAERRQLPPSTWYQNRKKRDPT
jgi:hypothetical protein